MGLDSFIFLAIEVKNAEILEVLKLYSKCYFYLCYNLLNGLIWYYNDKILSLIGYKIVLQEFFKLEKLNIFSLVLFIPEYVATLADCCYSALGWLLKVCTKRNKMLINTGHQFL